MFLSTLSQIQCPKSRCKGSELKLEGAKYEGEDMLSGSLACPSCRSSYPILGGVAILVEDIGDYLMSHIKGIAREVPESAFPKEFLPEMIEAKREIQSEHIEEDLESERVTALYVMTQYLDAKEMLSMTDSPQVQELIRKYWDQAPFDQIEKQLGEITSLVEIGCGAGGLLAALSGKLKTYLGADSSFASIALARKIALGCGDLKEFKVPADLFQGATSRDVSKSLKAVAARIKKSGVKSDFIVADATSSAIRPGFWDASAALNIIDMLDRPEELPKLQKSLVRKGGWAIQSSPYVWHPQTGAALKKKFPQAKSSADTVEKLYEREGFKIEHADAHVPWLFFKHARQIELYSVHLISAKLF